jgi:aminotransferase
VAARAAILARSDPGFVRGDIGQIVGLDPSVEVLYGPPVGIEPLREAVAEFWTRTFHLDDPERLGHALRAENIAVTTGAAEALTLLFRCFAAGKTVGLPRGYWENYLNGVSLAGGHPVVVDYFDEQGALDLEGLGRSITALKVSCLVANFPSNPTGAVLGEGEARALAGFLRDHDLLLIADEVYSRLRFDGAPPVSLLAFAPERVVTLSSASKEYLIPGARVGYVVSDRPALTDEVLRKLIRANTASPNVLGQQRVLDLMSTDLAALREGREPELLGRIRTELGLRRDALVSVLRKHGFELVGRPGHEPMGTIFLMASLPDWWKGNDLEFVEAALERSAFSSVPGSAFGLEGSVRFSFGSMSVPAIAELDRRIEAWRKSVSRK